MLYGISLLAGVLGSCHLPTMAARMAQLFAAHNASADQAIVMALGGLMIGVGLAFKLSAFPFHFWCPDVFEGASAEVNAFLSVASKAAALALLVRCAWDLQRCRRRWRVRCSYCRVVRRLVRRTPLALPVFRPNPRQALAQPVHHWANAKVPTG